MTVTYSLDVANSSFFCLYRLLFRWKGSIWKSVWAELMVWMILYSLLSILYRFLLTKPQREVFEDLCVFFDTYSSFIPITFMLGFYVSAVFTRWWQIFDNIGWIDTPCLWIAQYVRGSNERARLIRRTLIRYLVLTQAIVFRDVSSAVKKRFPTMNHLVTSVRVAKEEGKIPGEMIYVDLMEKIRQYRVQVLSLTLYDWVPVPLVYTQVVHLAVRCYFAVGLMGRQYLNPDPARESVNNVPRTVAEVLLNPLGEDDDDFECNWILDRNLQVGFNVVDKTYDRFPDMVRDKFWEDAIPEPLYTAESAQRPINPQVGSCADLITEEDAYMMRPRRRTISHTSHWDGEVENDEVIPVLGADKGKETSSTTSGDSAAFSQSFMNQSRRISDMFKRMQGRRKSSTANASIARIWKGQRVSDINVEHAIADSKSNKSSSSSLDRFNESFHNNVTPPNVQPINANSNLLSDNMKIANEDRGLKSPNTPTSAKSVVQWLTDELSVIEEEDPDKRRTSEEDSLKGSISGSSRAGSRDFVLAVDTMPTVLEKDEQKNDLVEVTESHDTLKKDVVKKNSTE
ncbi:hypothetical protein KIN20_034117 [Parelaphostrongylus tenuis]|uniref:Bestrophin homolog n=1 Tax=Parelaphostrongylus tenuis TaxID=148309 RepID=A0AAD5R973_PARTN|nr:hypothetical protein KIN20_034117 [Parelaphostrongylus tenuis]